VNIDSLIVAGYFVLVTVAGYWISRRHKAASASDFVTGGRTCTWRQTGLALLGMAVDPGYMSIAGLGFAFGLYLTQWTAVHVWFTAWFAAMFFVPIYWRSRIVTTPEFLEKRFNVQCRVVFSLLMVVLLVMTLALGLYLGALLLQSIIGWPFPVSVAFIAIVTAFYVLLGGMRTVMILDTYQAIFLFVTLLAVAGMAVYHVGGPAGLAAIKEVSDAGTRLSSVVPPSTWKLATDNFFHAQGIALWATVVGLSWLACNFGMVQRILAAKSERDAQKSLLFLASMIAVVPTCSFLVGVCVRHLDANHLLTGLAAGEAMKPDKAFLYVMLNWFPVGLRGLLAAGMMAALLSTADGLLTGSSALLSEDVYFRFVRPKAGERERKNFVRGAEVATLIAGVSLVPVLMNSRAAMAFVQAFYADLFGVIVALYLVGIFSKRAAPKSAFFAIVSGIVFAIVLDKWSHLNFAYVGFFSFAYTLLATLILSRFERPVPLERLLNLTVYTLEDVKGPWVGLKAWPGLWKWALLLAVVWFALSAAWEMYVRSR
jgi:solute:Na+ symporter, SSS family